LDLSEGWWQHRVVAGDVALDQFFAILDHLGLDPIRFLRRNLGRELDLGLDRPRGPAPEIVEKGWDRVCSGAEGRGIGETYLETLDQQRYQEPEKVARLCLRAVDHVELSLLPRLLGIVGSTFRLLIRLDEAEHAMHAGIEIARLQADRSAEVDLLQRLSYVVADRGHHGEALWLAEKAATRYLRLGDEAGLGKALVDQGIWLYYLDRSRESIEVLQASLDFLPEALSRNRCTAFQCMASAQRNLGELEAAFENVIAAREIAVDVEEVAQKKLLWLQANLQADLGRLEEAAASFSEVVDFFREIHPGETALATCDLVRVQVLQGDAAQAGKTAASMRALLEPLRYNEILSAAVAELLRCRHEGLTPALVERVRASIESERQHLEAWRALQCAPSSDQP